jgi:hypothetical protein
MIIGSSPNQRPPNSHQVSAPPATATATTASTGIQFEIGRSASSASRSFLRRRRLTSRTSAPPTHALRPASARRGLEREDARSWRTSCRSVTARRRGCPSGGPPRGSSPLGRPRSRSAGHVLTGRKGPSAKPTSHRCRRGVWVACCRKDLRSLRCETEARRRLPARWWCARASVERPSRCRAHAAASCPRRLEYTICTAVAPDAVFTVRT